MSKTATTKGKVAEFLMGSHTQKCTALLSFNSMSRFSFHRCHSHTLQCAKVTFFSSKAQSTHSPSASFPSTPRHHPKEGRPLHPPHPASPVVSLGLSAFPFKASGLFQTRLTRAKGPAPLTRGIWAALFFQFSRNCDSAAKKPGAHSEDLWAYSRFTLFFLKLRDHH